MLAVFRSYRFIPRVFALLMLGAGLLPFAAHACASMTGEATMHQKCCCMDRSEDDLHKDHRTAAMAHQHTSSHEMHDMPATDAEPCEHHKQDIPAPEGCCKWAVESSIADDYVQARAGHQLFPVPDTRTRIAPDEAARTAYHSEKPPDPPLLSAPARHVLFAAFLI